MNVKGTIGLLKDTFKDFSDDECPVRAAALSYYTVFSLPPLLILILLIAGSVFDPAQVQQALTEQMGGLMGAKGAVEILYRAELGDADRIAARTKDYEDRFANPFVAAERGFIDEVIMPHSTRKRVARAFASLRQKRLSNPWKKHDNIPL